MSYSDRPLLCQVKPGEAAQIIHSDKYSLEECFSSAQLTCQEALELVLEERAQLWAVFWQGEIIAFMLSTVIQAGPDRIGVVNGFGGHNFKQGRRVYSAFGEWAKYQGCNKMRAYCRPGVRKLLVDISNASVIGQEDGKEILEMDL